MTNQAIVLSLKELDNLPKHTVCNMMGLYYTPTTKEALHILEKSSVNVGIRDFLFEIRKRILDTWQEVELHLNDDQRDTFEREIRRNCWHVGYQPSGDELVEYTEEMAGLIIDMMESVKDKLSANVTEKLENYYNVLIDGILPFAVELRRYQDGE